MTGMGSVWSGPVWAREKPVPKNRSSPVRIQNLGPGSWVLGPGEPGSWILGPGSGIQKTGPARRSSPGRSSFKKRVWSGLVLPIPEMKMQDFGGVLGVCPINWEPGEKTLKPGLDLVGKI